MNINIARIILAIIAAAGLAQAAHAEPASMQLELASNEVRAELSSAAYASPNGSSIDPADTVSAQPAVPGTSAQDAGGSARSVISPVGGVWLFLGSIWIIGTLLHHRREIQRH